MSSDPTFTPTMPYPIPTPWPAPWNEVLVVYDQYACEAFLDDEPQVMAESRRAFRVLAARSKEISALPDGPEKDEADQTWVTDRRVWRRANCLLQVQYFVLRVEWPDGTATPGSDTATWAKFPLKLLEWVADDGYAQARDALWTHPKTAPLPETAPASS